MSIFKKKEKVVEPDITASTSGNEEVDAEAIMRKYDKESNTRIWEDAPKIVIIGVMVAFSVYCLCMTLFSLEQAETRLARFVAGIIIIGYLMYPASKTDARVNHIPWYDIVLMVVGARRGIKSANGKCISDYFLHIGQIESRCKGGTTRTTKGSP